MPSDGKDGKLQLGEPWTGKLADYCSAINNAPKREVIRAALDAYIDSELAENPGIKKRFDAARTKRLAPGENVRTLRPVGDET